MISGYRADTRCATMIRHTRGSVRAWYRRCDVQLSPKSKEEPMNPRFQRLTSFVAAVVLAVPLSAFAESRRIQRTDLRQLADDISRALGSGHVEVEGVEHTNKPFDDAIVAAMNRERAAHGLRPLRLNDRLTLAAEDR